MILNWEFYRKTLSHLSVKNCFHSSGILKICMWILQFEITWGFLPHTLKSWENNAHINTLNLSFLRCRTYSSHLVASGSKMDLIQFWASFILGCSASPHIIQLSLSLPRSEHGMLRCPWAPAVMAGVCPMVPVTLRVPTTSGFAWKTA